MKTSQLLKKIEDKIPLELALDNDTVGFMGSEEILDKDIKKVLVLMDYIPQEQLNKLKNENLIKYDDFDLVILHHPPLFLENQINKLTRDISAKNSYHPPVYVIHSNWDILKGGACDALADILGVNINQVLDPQTGIGRIGKLKNGSVYLDDFVEDVLHNLSLNQLRMVNTENTLINNVAVVSGFGLNPSLIKMAHDKGADLYLSGDLTHPGAMLAKNLGISLIDASHHATELPGLYRLGELISQIGLDVQVFDSKIPWKTCYL